LWLDSKTRYKYIFIFTSRNQNIMLSNTLPTYLMIPLLVEFCPVITVLQFTTSDYPLRYLQCFPIWKKTLRNCRFLFTVYIATLSCLIYKYNNTTWFISLKSLIYINCQAPSRISTCIANIKRLIQRSTFSWEKNTHKIIQEMQNVMKKAWIN
jgi:hypothetical protein